LGVLPSLLIDFDYRLLYAFASGSILAPAATKGRWIPLAAGAGLNLASRGNWTMVAWAHYSPSCVEPSGKWWYHAIGLGLGATYTSPNGFTMSFKVPLFGYSFRSGEWADRWTGGMAVGHYYSSAFTSLPVFAAGYRF
jgi:hypothetical protein